jgi:pimeloyl-ACP methyl ester carboxylesterase
MDASWIDRLVVSRSADFNGSTTITTPTAILRVRDEGTAGDPIVFVCDTPVFIEHYDRLFSLLTPTMRVVCLELPGMGFSMPRGDYRFSLQEQARAVVAALDALQLRACTLAFACVGAYLAPLIGEWRPDLVRRAILIQAPSWQQESLWARRIDFRGAGIVAIPYVGQSVVRAFRTRIARRWFEKALAPGRAHPFITVAEAAFAGGASWALGSLVQSYFGDAEPNLRPLRVPTLALWGELDRTHRDTDKRSVLSLAPDAHITTLKTAGHCPELEEPERFCELLNEFLAVS